MNGPIGVLQIRQFLIPISVLFRIRARRPGVCQRTGLASHPDEGVFLTPVSKHRTTSSAAGAEVSLGKN
jgi:hypothetical protein